MVAVGSQYFYYIRTVDYLFKPTLNVNRTGSVHLFRITANPFGSYSNCFSRAVRN